MYKADEDKMMKIILNPEEIVKFFWNHSISAFSRTN